MLNQTQRIFLVGIKGVAMANLALILQKMGKKVSGSDVSEEFITDELLTKNALIFSVGFSREDLPKDTDLVIYSSGHQGRQNPQVLEAQKRRIKTITQAEFLGELTKQFKTTLAVCGCHGKTTTSALLAYSLKKLGAKPSYMVGSSDFNHMPGGNYESDEYFVIEADEYGVNPPYDLSPKFHFLNPDYILCTNIDFDHPDVYKDLQQTQDVFLKFFADRKLILCADDVPTVQSTCPERSRRIKRLNKKQYVLYGFSQNADLKISDTRTQENSSSFLLTYHKKPLGRFSLKLFGDKNISNAAGVVLTLLQLGFSGEKIKRAIKDFSGAKRRFERVYQTKGTLLFDDYAHHPQEIEATIKAARNRFPGKKITVIFQPHTFSRTKALLPDFAKSLSLADKALILPVFPSARENASAFHVSSSDISKLNPERLVSFPDKKPLISYLLSFIKSGDVIFTMGAGDVYKLKNDIIDLMKLIH